MRLFVLKANTVQSAGTATHWCRHDLGQLSMMLLYKNKCTYGNMAPLIPLPPTELHYCPTVERIKQHTWGSPNQVLVCNKQGRELRGMQTLALSNLTAISCSISSPLCIHKQQVNKSMLCWPDLSCLPPAASEPKPLQHHPAFRLQGRREGNAPKGMYWFLSRLSCCLYMCL